MWTMCQRTSFKINERKKTKPKIIYKKKLTKIINEKSFNPKTIFFYFKQTICLDRTHAHTHTKRKIKSNKFDAHLFSIQ